MKECITHFIIQRLVEYIKIPHGQNDVLNDYVNKICEIFEMAQDEDFLTLKIEYVQNQK